MAKRLILNGRVQGVLCRAYCSQYARLLRIRGSASNMSDGTVRVILDTEDQEVTQRYVSAITHNPRGLTFYGRIDTVDVDDYHGPISGDYQF